MHRQEFAELEVGETVTELNIDGGKARLRTEKGQVSEWRDYKAVTLNKQNCAAFFQENHKLLASVNEMLPWKVLLTIIRKFKFKSKCKSRNPSGKSTNL